MPGQNRRAVVLGGVMALLLAFALWHFVLDSGGGGSNSATSTTLPGLAATSPLPATTTAPGTTATSSGSAPVDIVSNPFLPKYVAPTVDTTPSTGGTTVDTSGGGLTTPNTGTNPTVTTFTPAITSPPNVTQAPTSSGSSSGLPTSLDGVKTIRAVTVQLLGVGAAFGQPTATVKLGDKTDTVTVGQTFETSYRLLSLTDRCGTFVYGDSPFQVCVGETAVK
ncbi:MAG: hypothetical protein JWL73_906 [Actinomycetia bacterium]|nr:hypothetical protein [Actinomycetes bacterium]